MRDEPRHSSTNESGPGWSQSSPHSAVCRPSLAEYGEPQAGLFNNNLATLVGWGRTSWVNTDKNSSQTQVQQKLETPVISNLNCVSRLEDILKLDLSQDLR